MQVDYMLCYFNTSGQQESSCDFLLQSQTGVQLRIRLDLHPINHFREDRKYTGDGIDGGII